MSQSPLPSSAEQRRVEITQEPIDPAQLLAFVTTPTAGAVVLFLGTVREWTQGRRTRALDYDAYPAMALKSMHSLVDAAMQQYPLAKVALVHRLGRLELTEASVAVAVSSPHRQAAFSAGQQLIDELKREVPIWKKEHWDDGTTEWVHPGMPPAL